MRDKSRRKLEDTETSACSARLTPVKGGREGRLGRSDSDCRAALRKLDNSRAEVTHHALSRAGCSLGRGWPQFGQLTILIAADSLEGGSECAPS